MRHDESQHQVAAALGFGERLALRLVFTRIRPVREQPVLQTVEAFAQDKQRRPRFLVCGKRITIARNARERRFQASNGRIELAVEGGGQLVVSMDLAQHTPDACSGEHGGDGIGGPSLALMRFVEHGDVVRRQEAAADGQVEKEERVIDDDDVGILGLIPFVEVKTISEMRAVLADAFVGIGIELLPFTCRQHERQLRTIAGLRARGPFRHALQARRRRQRPVFAHSLELLPAEIVRASLEQRDSHGDAESGFHQRNIFLNQLLLQSNRPR